MLSITAAARHLNLPRDTVLKAIHQQKLRAIRDQRGTPRILMEDLQAFQASRTPAQIEIKVAPATSPARRYTISEGVIWLSVAAAERVPYLIAQHHRITREMAEGRA